MMRDSRLPLERPPREATRIYGRRLGAILVLQLAVLYALGVPLLLYLLWGGR